MDDQQILAQVHSLVEREHGLREQVQSGELGSAEEQAQLKAIEVELDQCWDLLRQRRAKREFGNNPDVTASARPAAEVEGYLQ